MSQATSFRPHPVGAAHGTARILLEELQPHSRTKRAVTSPRLSWRRGTLRSRRRRRVEGARPHRLTNEPPRLLPVAQRWEGDRAQRGGGAAAPKRRSPPGQFPEFDGEEAWFRVRWVSKSKREFLEQVEGV